MKARITILSFITILLCAPLWAAPKLIVTVTVEDMDTEYLKRFESEFSHGGFRRMEQGEKFEKVEFSYNTTDYAADIATVYTGTEPCFNGIVAKKYYNTKEQKDQLTLLDKESHGFNDDYNLSGKALVSTTFADKLFEETYGIARIVSIATDPTIAMLMAGHSGTPIYMNNITGEWSTSSYYIDKMPKWLDDYNSTRPIEAYLDKTWENIQPAGYYVMAARKGGIGFNYSVRGVCNGIKIYDNFNTLPQCNDYICDLALKAVDSEKMGNDYVPDLLMVNFSLKKFYMKPDDPYSLELEDAYLRLDKTLMRLIETLENKVGKDNIVIVLMGARTGSVNVTSGINQRIKYEPFNIDRYLALLNSYLMAHFGQKRWVLSVGAGNIHLNRDEIERSGLKLEDVQAKAMEFFYLIPGLQNLCTAQQMETSFYSTGVLRYAYYRGISGDLLYSLMPRWYEVDIKDNPTGYFTSYSSAIPAWIYGGAHTDATTHSIKATELFERIY